MVGGGEVETAAGVGVRNTAVDQQYGLSAGRKASQCGKRSYKTWWVSECSDDAACDVELSMGQQ